jgi:hypothetical protein
MRRIANVIDDNETKAVARKIILWDSRDGNEAEMLPFLIKSYGIIRPYIIYPSFGPYAQKVYIYDNESSFIQVYQVTQSFSILVTSIPEALYEQMRSQLILRPLRMQHV